MKLAHQNWIISQSRDENAKNILKSKPPAHRYLEPKWGPLFGLEKAFFWRVVSPQNRRQTDSRYILYNVFTTSTLLFYWKSSWWSIFPEHKEKIKKISELCGCCGCLPGETCPKKCPIPNSSHLRRGSRSKFSCKRWTLRGILAAVLRRNSFGLSTGWGEKMWWGKVEFGTYKYHIYIPNLKWILCVKKTH